MHELRPRIWHWRSSHPDWDEEQWWPQLVSSYAVELGRDLILFDPLSVPGRLRERATAVVLTAPWHERDSRLLGLPVHTPPADTWQEWVEKFGVDPDRVRGWRVMISLGSEWARARDSSTVLDLGRSALTHTRVVRTTIWSCGFPRSGRS
jgi:hypothetical protein